MFNGRNTRVVFEEGKKWIPYVTDIFLPIIDAETGDLRFLPFDGDTLDQPYMTMNVIKLIQSNYRQVMKKRNDEQMKAMKGRRR